MPSIVIKVDNLSKVYQIGAPEKYKTFRESLVKAITFPFNKISRLRGPSLEKQMIWALKEVSFEVKKGEVIGLIGRNGAGKTTLLKILSRITYPTGGRVTIKGRVASLLEVGTGFHPELTGRENVYLNGAILGMRRTEINKKFDEIVAFSEIEKFIDTPIKRYSSGMYVRLAFAVAAHLEPEILMVDEVLAVGDAAFQKKCLGKMGEVARGGRTILFVSHNMAAVENLCEQAIVLESGSLTFQGTAHEATKAYLNSCMGQVKTNLAKDVTRVGNGKVFIRLLTICDMESKPIQGLSIGEGCKIYLDYESKGGYLPTNVEVGVAFISVQGVKVVMFNNTIAGFPFQSLPRSGRICCSIPSLPIAQGEYLLGVSFSSNGEINDWVDRIMSFTIYPGDFYGSGKLYQVNSSCVYLPNSWEII